MLALQLHDPMGLGADGAFHAAVTETVAERVARIRAKMLTWGVPAALISGGATTLIFAGAFAFAKSERVWAPALWLGGVSTVAALVGTLVASKAAETAASDAAKPATITIEPATAAASKSAYGY